MNDLKKQIILDLFITPWTVVPFVLGGTLLMLSGILGGSSAFYGFVGITLSFGALLTNWVFNLNQISKNAVDRMHRQEKQKREAELDLLDKKLVRTKGSRDQIALRNLRTLYNSFCEDLRQGKIANNVPPNMIQLIEDIFAECVRNLSRSYDIWRTSKKLEGDLKNDLENQQEHLIEDVEESVKALAETISEVRALNLKTSSNDMQKLRDKLVSQLQVAKATEESIALLDGDLSRQYDEYS